MYVCFCAAEGRRVGWIDFKMNFELFFKTIPITALGAFYPIFFLLLLSLLILKKPKKKNPPCNDNLGVVGRPKITLLFKRNVNLHFF